MSELQEKRRCPCGGEMCPEELEIGGLLAPLRFRCAACGGTASIRPRRVLNAILVLGLAGLFFTVWGLWELYAVRIFGPRFIPDSEAVQRLMNWADGVLILVGMFVASIAALMAGLGLSGLIQDARHPLIEEEPGAPDVPGSTPLA
jgi:hypothetical protein